MNSTEDRWSACPAGEISHMVGQLRAQRRRVALVRVSGTVAAVLFFAVAIGLIASAVLPSIRQVNYGDIACSEVSRVLSGYQDGTLDAPAQRKVKIHLEHCSRCRQRYERMLDAPADATPTATVNRHLLAFATGSR